MAELKFPADCLCMKCNLCATPDDAEFGGCPLVQDNSEIAALKEEIKRGGPLSCRECGRPVNREEPEVHFIEDGKCDCKACYDKAMNDVRIFEIWQEGYCVTGDGGPAAHLGNASGKDFRSACVDFFKEKGNKDFDVDELSVWGCSLFDNEKDARKLFG